MDSDCEEPEKFSLFLLSLFDFFFRQPMRFHDLPVTSVIELKGNKEIGAKTKACVLTIALDPLRHGRIHNQTACIEPLFWLDRPPLHVKECVLRKAFFLRLRFYKLTGLLHKLVTVAQRVFRCDPLIAAQLIDGSFVSFSSATANGKAFRVRRPNRCRRVGST